MLRKTSIVLTVLTLSFFVMFLSGCTMNSVSKRLKSKHYIVKVETKKPEIDKGDVIKKSYLHTIQVLVMRLKVLNIFQMQMQMNFILLIKKI